MFSILLDIYLRVQLLGQMVISVFKFLHSLIMKVIIAILLGYLSLCGFAYISVINNVIGYLFT